MTPIQFTIAMCITYLCLYGIYYTWRNDKQKFNIKQAVLQLEHALNKKKRR